MHFFTQIDLLHTLYVMCIIIVNWFVLVWYHYNYIVILLREYGSVTYIRSIFEINCICDIRNTDIDTYMYHTFALIINTWEYPINILKKRPVRINDVIRHKRQGSNITCLDSLHFLLSKYLGTGICPPFILDILFLPNFEVSKIF